MTTLQIAAALDLGGFGFEEAIDLAKKSGCRASFLKDQLRHARTNEEINRKRAETLEAVIEQIEREG